jgi:hypothetical protein
MAELTQERLKSVLDYDQNTGIFTRKIRTAQSVRVGDIAGYIRKDGYVFIGVNNTQYLAHRLAILYVFGYLPKNDTDHINGDRSDNRICNLRCATRSENLQNIKKQRVDNKSTGLLGAYFNKHNKRYYSRIALNGIDKFLGNFNTAEEANIAYLNEKRKIHEYNTL